MMLDLPGVVVAELVGELDLAERVLQELVLALGAPRPRQLVFVEDAEFHGLILFRHDGTICRHRTSRSGRSPSESSPSGSHGPSPGKSGSPPPARGARRRGRIRPAATGRPRRAAPESAP